MQEWKAANPDVAGAAMVVDEAFKLGAHIFGGLLTGGR
jgi:hypothetical protein